MRQPNTTGWIYMIVNLVDGRKYVGQTCKKPKYRWSQHLKAAEQDFDYRPLYMAMRHHGKQNFEFRVLQENVPVDILDYTETFYIAKYEAKTHGYNIQEGGRKDFVMEFSENHRENLSEAGRIRAKNNPEWYKQHISKMNKARLEKGFSDEFKKLRSLQMMGNQYKKGKKQPPLSEETKLKMSLASKGVCKSETHKQAMRDGWAKRKERIAPLFLVN